MTTETETGILEEVREEQKVKQPNLWRVIFHNDNKTTMEFVIFLLIKVFYKKNREAIDIMLTVHEKGKAVVGIYTHEIAENKMHICLRTAKDQGFPLAITIEEEQ